MLMIIWNMAYRWNILRGTWDVIAIRGRHMEWSSGRKIATRCCKQCDISTQSTPMVTVNFLLIAFMGI